MSDEFWEGTITAELDYNRVRALRHVIETYKEIPVEGHPEEGPPPVDFDVLDDIDDQLNEKVAEKKYLED